MQKGLPILLTLLFLNSRLQRNGLPQQHQPHLHKAGVEPQQRNGNLILFETYVHRHTFYSDCNKVMKTQNIFSFPSCVIKYKYVIYMALDFQ